MKAIVKQGYLYTEPRDANADIAVGAQAWFDWLDQHDHFVFQGDDDRFTARQETIRGGSYWYGYRRRKGRLYKVYLGRAADLTLDKLHAAEGKFTQREQPAAESALAPLSALDLATSLRTVVVSARQRENAAVTNLPFTLLTRLIPPALPTSLIARPRLLRQISTPITLVTAPSGFGKTTLVNQWRTARLTNPPTTPPSTAPQSPKIVWISLETDERNPHSFWATMMAALEQSEIDTGKSASALLQSPTHVSLEQILANFIQTISRWQASQPAHQLVLILDNYQRVRSTDIDAACQFFLDHLPPNVQMVLTSQAQFPFAVQRWRAQGILAELTADDLLLTPEEGAAYLDRIATIPLTAREKLSLSVRAGGWAAGLNLLALALKKQEDVHRFIATFDGKHPFLQTYFVEEILARQPAEIQAFLLQTSILRNLKGALCDSVTQQRGSQQILRQLYRSNQFVTLVDEVEGWHQYHDLFAQALQQQLQQDYPAQIPDLHRRAAAWYQENGLYSEVIRHLLRAGAWTELGQIIEGVVLDELRRGSDDRVLRWIQQLPDDLFLRHSTLLLTYARIAMPSLPLDQVKRQLDRIVARIKAIPAAALTPEQKSLLAGFARWEKAVATGGAPQPPSPAASEMEQVGYLLDLYIQARHLIRHGEIEACESVLRQVVERAQAQGIVYGVLAGGGNLVELLTMQGRLREGETVARAALQFALAQTGTLASCASIPLTALGKISYARNQLAQARQLIDDAVMLDPHPTSLNQVMHHHLLLAHLHNAQGDKLVVQAALQGALEQEPYATQVIMAQDLKIFQALFAVRQGQVVLAGQLLRQISPYPLPAHLMGDGLLKMAWAELFLAQQQYMEAETVLTLPGKTSLHVSNLDVLPYRNLLIALAYWGQQKVLQAQQEVAQALRLAESEGIVRPFLDCGPRLIPLLVDILDLKTLSRLQREFVRGLLTEFSLTYPGSDIAPAPTIFAPVPVSLTAREQEILRMLDEGMDNKAMARRLVIADSTLRTHLRNLYAKLEVTSRTQAVRQARHLHLL